MVTESIPFIEGSQLAITFYMALELSQIKRAMGKSDAIEYEKPALFEEFMPVKLK